MGCDPTFSLRTGFRANELPNTCLSFVRSNTLICEHCHIHTSTRWSSNHLGTGSAADPLDTNWWTFSSSAGDEFDTSSGSPQLGLVTGSSGRGLHTVFPTQTLGVGDKIKATFTFNTPTTIGTNDGGFRIGLFDTLGRDTVGVSQTDSSGTFVQTLDEQVDASSGTPNNVYGNGSNTTTLPGYMMTFDVSSSASPNTASEIEFREHISPNGGSGRLMATTSGGTFPGIGSGADNPGYSFAPNEEYTGMFTITRTTATDVQLDGMIAGPGANASFSTTDAFDSNMFGMLAFHVNGDTFGSVNTAGMADNGINFSNVTVHVENVPEPSAITVIGLSLGMLAVLIRRRRK